VLELTALQFVLLFAAIAVVAFLYSSVGHGGATGYLAAAALLGLAPEIARPGALWLNCVVASIAFWRFRSAGHFDGRIFLSLAMTSVPLAWLGSQMHLTGRTYGVVLGVTLAVAGVLLFLRPTANAVGTANRPKWPLALAVGGVLGLLAGLTGIGGGVFLTPLLIFLHWTPAKTAGGISALFILVNSVAGLAGLGKAAVHWQPVALFAPLLGAAGALAGTYFGVRRWAPTSFRRALALVLWIAAAKLLLTGK
jgi:uncharacterized membrane protein YfcA